MKVLVTGAAGFIGSHVAEALCRRGDEVVAVDSFDPYYSVQLKRHTQQELISQGIMIYEMDLCKDPFPSEWEGVAAVVHLAAQPGNSVDTTFERYVNNNLIATKMLLNWAANQNLKLFLNISTSSVYGKFATRTEDALPQPISAYGVTKLAAEQLVLAQHRDAMLPAASLRLYSVYGARERPDKLFPTLIRTIISGHDFPLFEGSEKHQRSFTFIEDIVDGIIAALDSPEVVAGEIFNLGCESSIGVGEAIALVEAILGKQARLRRLPRRVGDQEQTAAQIQKARTILGYQPKVLPEEGLRRTIEWNLAQERGVSSDPL